MNRKTRKSNFELLRIISMIMIILHHYSYHGGSFNLPIGPAKYVSQLFFVGGSLGVTLFMLISSYFLIDTKFSIKRILRIWFEIFFYCAGISIICYFAKVQTFTYKTWLQVLLPITFNATWFGIAYLFICFVSPFMNRLINSLSKRNYSALICVLFVFFVAIPTITFPAPQRVCFNVVSWFVCMYFLAGYIKRFSFKVFDNKAFALLVFIVSVLLIWGSEVLFTKLGQTRTFFSGSVTFFTNYDSIFMVLAATSLFMFFKNIDLGSNKLINAISSTAFGVYLIHDNIISRMKMWKEWFNTGSITTPAMLLLHGLFVALVIYAACSVIDWVRIVFIENPLFSIKKFDPYFEKFNSILDLSKIEIDNKNGKTNKR